MQGTSGLHCPTNIVLFYLLNCPAVLKVCLSFPPIQDGGVLHSHYEIGSNVSFLSSSLSAKFRLTSKWVAFVSTEVKTMPTLVSHGPRWMPGKIGLVFLFSWTIILRKATCPCSYKNLGVKVLETTVNGLFLLIIIYLMNITYQYPLRMFS
jgi:hypothetical protein